MSFKKTFVGLLAVLVVAAIALPALAQETSSGTLEGKVTDDKGEPVPGATISATGPQGLVPARTGPDGKFSIPFLKGGKYEVKVEAPGFATIILKDVEVQIERRTSLPIQMSAGKVETVTVQGQAPLIDTKSTSIGTNIKIDEFVTGVPIGRTYSDTFAVAPGVVSGGGTGSGNYSIGGASGLENQYIIDGVNITNTGYGGIGSYNVVYGSLGTGVTTDFLDEIQIKTGGFEPEFGGATGGVLNTTVKSGTNDFSGAINLFYTPRNGYSSFKQTTSSIGSINTEDKQTTDVGLSVGGPIIKDRLFYFAAFNPVRQKDRFTIEDSPFDPDFAPPGLATFPAAEFGPQERTRTSYNWAAKMTWYATPNHRVELTGFGDPSKGKKGPQNSLALRFLDYNLGGGQSDLEYGGNNYAVKYNGVFNPNFFGEFQVSLHKAKFRENSVLNETRIRDRRQQLCFLFPNLRCAPGVSADAGTVWFTGGTGYLSNADDKNTTYSAKLTNVVGPLEVKYGLEYYNIEYTDQQGYTGDPVDFFIPVDSDLSGAYDVGEGVFIPSNTGTLIDERASNNFRAIRNRLNPFPGPTKTKDANAFVQGTWTVTPQWVVKAGVRATRQKIEGSGGAFSLPWHDVLEDTDGDGTLDSVLRGPGSTDFSSRKYTFDTVFAPRLGVTFDVTGDGRSKLYANWGRFYERVPNDLAVRALSTEVSTSVYRFRAVGPNNQPITPDPQVNPASGIVFQGLDETRVQNNTNLPYKTEYVLGYAYQLRPNLSVEVRGIYRKQGRALEDVQFARNESIQNQTGYYGYGTDLSGDGTPDVPYDPFGGSLANPRSTTFPAAPFGAYVLANPGENTPASSGFTKPLHKYKAFEVIVNKRFSDHWLFVANYRYSRLRGNYEGLFRNDNGQSDPNITSLFDFPPSPTMRGQFQPGPLNNDRPHVLNMFASYKWDNGINVGAAFTWQSGIPRTPLLAHPNYQNAGEIPGRDPVYFWWTGQDDGTGNPIPGSVQLAKGPSTDFFNTPQITDTANCQPGQQCSLMATPVLFDYTDCKRGCSGRTSDEATLDLHLGYTWKIKDTSLDFGLDVFNVFDTQEPNSFNDNVESTAGIPDPDFQRINGYQTPRHFRVSARWAF